jgi:hypothetical protein
MTREQLVLEVKRRNTIWEAIILLEDDLREIDHNIESAIEDSRELFNEFKDMYNRVDMDKVLTM